MGNGSWAPSAHTHMEALIREMKNMELVAPPLVIHSSLKPSQTEEVLALADAVSDSVLKGE